MDWLVNETLGARYAHQVNIQAASNKPALSVWKLCTPALAHSQMAVVALQ